VHNDDRPLTESERNRLRSKRKFLVDEMTVEGLLNSLLSADCISDKHLETINDLTSRRNKIRELIDILQRRSIAQYKQFVECVRLNNQDHVAHALESNGGMVTFSFLYSFFVLLRFKLYYCSDVFFRDCLQHQKNLVPI